VAEPCRRLGQNPALLPPNASAPPPLPVRSGLVSLLVPLLLLAACAEEPLPRRQLTASDCLLEVELERLPEAIKRCDRVVAAFPADPGPLNDRYVLHSLAGDDAAACRDIARAAALARKRPADRLDPMLRRDLELRQAACRD
jgi:hypothetical protein